MRWVDERLAIGDASDAIGVAKLEAERITGVLSLDWFPLASPAPHLDWRKHALIDGAGNSAEDLLATLDDLQALLEHQPHVLVHCREGVSRSPFVVACHLATVSGKPLPLIIDELESRIGWISINDGLLETWNALMASWAESG